MRRALLSIAVVGLIVLAIPRETGATIEEQRARLPPAAACGDKIEGTWLGLHFLAPYWYEYTLVIHRTAPAKPDGSGPLEAEATSHFWSGGTNDTKPPPCKLGGTEGVVTMPAT